MIRFLIYSLFIIIVAYESLAESMLIIKPTSEIELQKNVTIGDIAIFKEVSKETQKKLSQIVLSNAPKSGEKRVYPKEAILLALQAHSEGLNLKNKLKYKIPNIVTVLSRGYSFNKENVIKKLSAEWKQSCDDCSFRFASLNLPMIPVATPIVNWEISPSHKIPRGNFASKVSITFENGVQSGFWITGQIKLFKKVPVFNRAMGAGERVQKQDVIWKEKDITFSFDSIPELSHVFGKQLKRSVRLDEVIYQNVIHREKALVRGQMVKVISTNKSWEISISGVAQQDGFEGDVVNVKNVKTNRLISGVITGKGEVTLQ